MPLHLPTFFTRLGSAVVFAAIMMAGLLWNEWGFLALVALIQVLCLRDYFRLMGKIEGNGKSSLGIWTQVGSLLILLMIGYSTFSFAGTWDLNRTRRVWDGFFVLPGPGYHRSPSQWLYAVCDKWPAMLFIPIALMLAGALSEKKDWRDGIFAAAGMLYIALPCALLIYLYSTYEYLPLVLILCIWMNDTMAYLVGSFIGKTPFSKISPKKTWEGTAGGALLTIAGAAIAAWLIPGQSMAAYIGIALCAAVAGTAGDLLESKLKRLAGVKDSGTMMPGHGGALDRFDSLLVATPFAFAWIYLLNLL